MGELIQASALGVGDVFTDLLRAPTWDTHSPLRRVTDIRTLNHGRAAYRVVEYTVLDSAAKGKADLRIETVVDRVKPIDRPEASAKVLGLTGSQALTFYCAEGRLWV